jgi:hypothetical protein
MATKKKRIAASAAELTRELFERMLGAPSAYRDGERVVPITYDLEAHPLEDGEAYDERDALAARARLPAISTPFVYARHTVHSQRVATECFNRLQHAQRSDDGVGVSFMTPNERALASEEWSRRLRNLVKAGERKEAANEPSVLVELQDID